MTESARQNILNKLRKAPSKGISVRSNRPEQIPTPADRFALTDILKENLVRIGCQVFQADDRQAVYNVLTDIFRQENIRTALTSDDETVKRLNLPDWAAERGYELKSLSDFKTPQDYKDAVFLEAEAGVTGVDYAAASTGSLVLTAGPRQARLVSLAPINHIAIVPISRVVPDHQTVLERVFGQGRRPSQVIWITGPSRTGDINAVIYTGMHGPKNVFVILAADTTE